MTVESCVAFCSGQNYIYAGVEYAQECCKCTLSLFFASVLPISALLTLPFVRQIVEMPSRMARRVLKVRIAVSRVAAMRVRLVAPATASACIGVVLPLRLHLKSYRALGSGLLWDVIRGFHQTGSPIEPAF